MVNLESEDRDRRETVDLLIADATVLPMHGPHQELPHCSIAISAGAIVEVGPHEELRRRYVSSRTIDATGLLAMPGLINGHGHLFQVMCRGLGDGCDLSNWAAAAIWPVARQMD